MRLLLSALATLVFIATAAAQGPRTSPSGPAIPSAYQKWLNEDVAYIIAPKERAAFLRLQTDDERDRFVEQFWSRRNPDPASTHNAFKEEHYRRIAYANQHFASDLAGWKTDRGRTYIVSGPPMSIDTQPRSAAQHAWQLWHYAGRDLRFVDTCDCGNYLFIPLHKGE